jgi:hypothetical protein
MMERPSLMQVVENLLRSNKELRTASASHSMLDIDEAASNIDWHLAQLCKAIGLDKKTLERAV